MTATTVETPWPSAMGDAPDLTLIAAAREGNPAAYQELYLRYRDVARRVATRSVPTNDVDDLVSEGFAAVFSALRAGRGPDQDFRAYLLAVQRRLAARWPRPGQKVIPVGEAEALDGLNDDAEGSAEDKALDIEAHRTIRDVFATLSDKARLVLWLVDVEGLSYAEAGNRLGLSATAVKGALSRARRDLQTGYLSRQIARSPGKSHPSAIELARYSMRLLTPAQIDRFDDHLTTCLGCAMRLKEAHGQRAVLRGLWIPGLLAPLVWPRRLSDLPQPPQPWWTRHPAPLADRGSPALLAGAGVAATGIGLALALSVATTGPSPTATPTTAPTPTTSGTTHAQWTPSASVNDLEPGTSTELPFRVWTDGTPSSRVELTFTLPAGLEAAQPYPECTTEGRTIVCPLLGYLDDGQFTGTLAVTVVSPDPAMPQVNAREQ